MVILGEVFRTFIRKQTVFGEVNKNVLIHPLIFSLTVLGEFYILRETFSGEKETC